MNTACQIIKQLWRKFMLVECYIILNETLYEIQQLLKYHSKTLSDFIGMPTLNENYCSKMSRIIIDELN